MTAVHEPDLPRPAVAPAEIGTPRVGLSGETRFTLAGGAVIVLLCLSFFTLASYTDADTWVPVSVLFFLVLLSVPICHRLAGTPRDGRLFKILLIAFALKMLFTVPRYALNEVYYKGEVDAARYDQAGDYFVQNVSQGDWSIEGSELDVFPKETRVVGYAVGVLYVVFGTSYFGGYLIFSWVSWLGLVCFFKAFRIAFPNAPPYRAAMLIFFLPSMLFWPSSLGKDAVMVCSLGLVALGVSRLLSADKVPLGLLWAALGLFLAGQVRPHLVLVSVVALAASSMARSSRASGSRAMVFRVALLLAIFPVMLVGMSRLESVVGGGGDSSLEENLDRTLERTNVGGSAFAATSVRSPLDVPGSIITVVYRPFLFEATNVGVLIAAFEGTILLVMTVLGARWVWRIGPAMLRSPMAAFCGAYSLAFVIAFSNIGNAGILARQRVQMFPFLMILVAAAHENHRLAELALEPEAGDPSSATSVVSRPESARLERVPS